MITKAGSCVRSRAKPTTSTMHCSGYGPKGSGSTSSATWSKADASHAARGVMTDEDDPQRVLAEAGAALIDAVPPAVTAWVERCVEGIVDAWAATPGSNVSAADRATVLANARLAREQAA